MLQPTNHAEFCRVPNDGIQKKKKKVRFNLKTEIIPQADEYNYSDYFEKFREEHQTECLQNGKKKFQLCVGGEVFEASKETLKRRKSTLADVVQKLECGELEEGKIIMHDSDFDPPQNTFMTTYQPTVFIDRDPKYFHLILYFLRSGQSEFLEDLSHFDLMELEKEAQYFQVESLLEILSHKLSYEQEVPKRERKKSKNIRKCLKSILRYFFNTPRNFPLAPKSRWTIWEPERWMDTSDEAQGLRQSGLCPSVFFAVSKLNVWDPTVYYFPPKGFHWATTTEFLKLVPSSVAEDAYFNKCGWKMCSWKGVTREAFLFLDTVFSHKWQHAGDCIGKLVHCKNLDWIRSVSHPENAKFNFAGIVCIKDKR